MRVIFHRLADAEYQRTCRLFARESVGKRNRFVQAVDEATARIVVNPAAGSPVHGPYRWVRAGQFKYILYYRQVATDLVVVYSVGHAGRRPGYWLRRTRRP